MRIRRFASAETSPRIARSNGCNRVAVRAAYSRIEPTMVHRSPRWSRIRVAHRNWTHKSTRVILPPRKGSPEIGYAHRVLRNQHFFFRRLHAMLLPLRCVGSIRLDRINDSGSGNEFLHRTCSSNRCACDSANCIIESLGFDDL